MTPTGTSTSLTSGINGMTTHTHPHPPTPTCRDTAEVQAKQKICGFDRPGQACRRGRHRDERAQAWAGLEEMGEIAEALRLDLIQQDTLMERIDITAYIFIRRRCQSSS